MNQITQIILAFLTIMGGGIFLVLLVQYLSRPRGKLIARPLKGVPYESHPARGPIPAATRSRINIPDYHDTTHVTVTSTPVKGGLGVKQTGFVANACGPDGKARSFWSHDQAIAEQQAKDFYKHGLFEK